MLFFSLVQVHEGILCFLCAHRLLLQLKRLKYSQKKIAIGTFYAFHSRKYMILSRAGIFGLIFFWIPTMFGRVLFILYFGKFPGAPRAGETLPKFSRISGVRIFFKIFEMYYNVNLYKKDSIYK